MAAAVGRVTKFVIPVLATVIIGVLFYAFYTASQETLAMNFQTRLEILIGDFERRSVVIERVGVPDGTWNSHKYDSDGIGGNYPLHTHDSTGTIYVESKVVRAYTLGDFFDVWGYPISSVRMLGLSNNSTHQWYMCYVPRDAEVFVPTDEFGAYVLKEGDVMHLEYSELGCG